MDNNPLLGQFGISKESTMFAEDEKLDIQEVVRLLPNKRLVCKAFWEKRPVYAKFFIGDNAKRHALRDAAGISYLLDAHVAAPALLYKQLDKQPCLLIYEAIENARNLEEIWPALDKTSQQSLVKKLIAVIAQHHNANLIQTDMYLKNFLLQEDAIVTLDGDGVRQFITLTAKKAISNLCVLLSKFDVLAMESWRRDLITVYQDARTGVIELDANLIKSETHDHRKSAANQYADKKVFRQCTDVDIVKSQGQLIAIATPFKHLNIAQSVQRLDTLIESQTRLKSGNTCTVSLASFEGENVVIKRYNIKSFAHRFSRMFRRTRASVSWANAHRLQLLGLPTPRPVALIEKRWLGLSGKAYFLSEYVDAPDAVVFFAVEKDKTIRASAVKQLVQLIYRLCLLNISHGDMKATNIKMHDASPMLIDLDSMKQHVKAEVAYQAHVNDIKRFMQNWKDEPSLYNAFVKVFKVVYVDHAPLQAAHILNNHIELT